MTLSKPVYDNNHKLKNQQTAIRNKYIFIRSLEPIMIPDVSVVSQKRYSKKNIFLKRAIDKTEFTKLFFFSFKE